MYICNNTWNNNIVNSVQKCCVSLVSFRARSKVAHFFMLSFIKRITSLDKQRRSHVFPTTCFNTAPATWISRGQTKIMRVLTGMQSHAIISAFCWCRRLSWILLQQSNLSTFKILKDLKNVNFHVEIVSIN